MQDETDGHVVERNERRVGGIVIGRSVGVASTARRFGQGHGLLVQFLHQSHGGFRGSYQAIDNDRFALFCRC